MGNVTFETMVTKTVDIAKTVQLNVSKSVTSITNIIGNLATAEGSADAIGFPNNLAEVDTFAQVEPGGAFAFSESLAAGNFNEEEEQEETLQTTTDSDVASNEVPVSLSLTTNDQNLDDTSPIRGTVDLGAPSVNTNFQFIIDTTGSTGDLAFPAVPVGDVNGDGTADTILDVAIQTTLDYLAALEAGDFDNANTDVQLISFNTGQPGEATVVGTFTNPFDGGLAAALQGLVSDGRTNFEAALELASSSGFFQSQPAGEENIAFFLSDGIPNEPDEMVTTYQDEANTLKGLANVTAIGVSAATATTLNPIDSSGSARLISSPGDLTFEDLIPNFGLELASLLIEVDGGAAIELVGGPNLTQLPDGDFEFDLGEFPGFGGMNGDPDVPVKATAIFDDGTMLMTQNIVDNLEFM